MHEERYSTRREYFIDGSGRGALSFGEREAPRRKRRTGASAMAICPATTMPLRVRMASTDPGGVKTASFQNLVEKHHDPLTRRHRPYSKIRRPADVSRSGR